MNGGAANFGDFILMSPHAIVCKVRQGICCAPNLWHIFGVHNPRRTCMWRPMLVKLQLKYDPRCTNVARHSMSSSFSWSRHLTAADWFSNSKLFYNSQKKLYYIQQQRIQLLISMSIMTVYGDKKGSIMQQVYYKTIEKWDYDGL